MALLVNLSWFHLKDVCFLILSFLSTTGNLHVSGKQFHLLQDSHVHKHMFFVHFPDKGKVDDIHRYSWHKH